MIKFPLLKVINQSRLFPFLVLLMILNLAACAIEDKKDPPDTTKTTKTDEPSPSETTAVVNTNTADTDATNGGTDTTETPTVAAGQNPVLCEGKKLAAQLLGITKQHSDIPYDTSDPSTQCSGIFQRVLGSIRAICPDAATKTPPENMRDSRGQAKWYYEKNALTLIKDPLAQAELIRPGVVMFYGKLDQDFYNSNPVEKLWTPAEGIRHVGIVVDVKRDEETGEIQSYSLFHGRHKDEPSGITNAEDDYMHRREGKGVPAFGNGSDPWVGVAAVVLQD